MASKETNEAIKEAKKVLIEISNDDRERELADLRRKYIMAQKAIEDRGMEKGIQLGQTMEKIVKELLKEKVDIEIIMKVTNLSKDEIEKIK